MQMLDRNPSEEPDVMMEGVLALLYTPVISLGHS
jgi:hypothetical protein